jgi:GNAT superfamily N-acetyltransferase
VTEGLRSRDSFYGMERELRIEPIVAGQLDRLLPMIAAYQRFYEVEEIDEARNRAFFSGFIAPSEKGMLLGARHAEELIGYACLYWSFTSLIPAETVLMDDLFVEPHLRGQGVGRALIEASAAVVRDRGAALLTWMTAQDNETAQRLYDTTGAERSVSIEYELEL